MLEVKGKTWWVVGLARSGCAAGALLRRHGATVVGIDDADEQKVHRRWERESLSILAPRAFDELSIGGTWPQTWPQAVVISPGVRRDHPNLLKLPAEVPVIGELELGAAFCRADLVAITGTNGKSTTTELVAHLVGKAGRQAEALGNLGTPLSMIADELSNQAVVSLEVSSFQLETVREFSPRVGLVLNLAPDHLDRYSDLAAYYRAKEILARQMKPEGCFITWTECQEARAWETEAVKRFFGDRAKGAQVYYRDGFLCLAQKESERRVLPTSQLALQSPPNLLNALAAVTVGAALDLPEAAMAEGLADFPGLAHRQQWVASQGDLRFINDTKATNVHAVCAGLDGYSRPVALIVGGSGKGESYAPLARVMASVVQVVAIGEEGPAISAALRGVVPVQSAGTMVEAVRLAADSLRNAPGITAADVLLSPACASFDMFDNYRHRGEAFLEAALAQGAVPREVKGE